MSLILKTVDGKEFEIVQDLTVDGVEFFVVKKPYNVYVDGLLCKFFLVHKTQFARSDIIQNKVEVIPLEPTSAEPVEPVKRRGRPKGSKNKNSV